MDWEKVLKRVDGRTARAFVEATRHLIDAVMIEGARVRQAQSPGAMDYESAGLSRASAAGGWISDDELRGAVQRMSEAIAREKWTEGVMAALKVLVLMGI